MEQKPLLQLKKIGQEYTTNGKNFVAISDVNVSVYPGEFVAIVGPSGCGKSTLLRIITGLQQPSHGNVLYHQRRLTGVNPYATIVFQSFALFPWLTVQENVEVALAARGIDPAQATLRAIELLDRVGLDGFETAYPRELSGGMRQKVGFARAMAVEPELLCLDEPFSALDILSAESLRSELLDLWREGRIPTKGILMITHNIEEAILMADRIIIMDKDPGRVIAEYRLNLKHPRNRKSPMFIRQLDKIYGLLAGKTDHPIADDILEDDPTQNKALPRVTMGELTGLLEHLQEIDGKADIYRLEQDLKISADHLLRLIKASGILHFVAVSEGDITLSPLGETFVDANTQLRKEIFAKRIKRLPLFKWLLDMLHQSDSANLEWDVTKAALEIDFSPKIAEKQLDILIDWGRYAEILTYNDTDGVIYLEK